MDLRILWGIVILLFILLEVFTFNLVALWFIAGALVSFALSFFVDSFATQLLVFGIVSLISLMLTKPLADKYMINKIAKNNAEYLVGKKGIVLKAPTKSTLVGQAKVDGKQWTISSSDKLKADDDIEVIDIEGIKLIVRKVNE